MMPWNLEAIINNIPDTKAFNDMVIKACYGIKDIKVNSNGRKKQLQSTIMLVLVLL
jgi:hypothetical protein